MFDCTSTHDNNNGAWRIIVYFSYLAKARTIVLVITGNVVYVGNNNSNNNNAPSSHSALSIEQKWEEFILLFLV